MNHNEQKIGENLMQAVQHVRANYQSMFNQAYGQLKVHATDFRNSVDQSHKNEICKRINIYENWMMRLQRQIDILDAPLIYKEQLRQIQVASFKLQRELEAEIESKRVFAKSMKGCTPTQAMSGEITQVLELVV